MRLSGKQIGHVAQRGHVQRVKPHLLAAHGIHRLVRQVLVFKLHVADSVGVRHFNLVSVAFPPLCAGFGVGHKLLPDALFGAVSGFGRDFLGQRILELEIALHDGIRAVNRPFLAAQIRGDDCAERIWVMPDFLCLDVVFIASGMAGFIVIQLILKLLFHLAVRTFRRQHVRLLCRICPYDESV